MRVGVMEKVIVAIMIRLEEQVGKKLKDKWADHFFHKEFLRIIKKIIIMFLVKNI